ncbi:MAG TPA: alginate export family protein [Mucilaginibacter sp.]|nr:alginate export family protein [Mucilaginibacter sp.]
MKTITTLFCIFISCTCFSQDIPFKQLRYDENYTNLSGDTSDNWYHRLKFDPLSKDKTIYLSIGGEVRYQYFHFKNQDWGEAPKDKDGFILTRYLGHLDFHAGRHFRTFVQLQSSLAGGEAETPSPVDQNLLDLHQAFFDLYADIGEGQSLTLRTGRQELSYGSQRLIAVREAPNNRQSFDAAKLIYSGRDLKLDVFYAHYVVAKPNIFDDGFSNATQFWGTYAVFNKVPIVQHVDLYYLGIHRKTVLFDDGKGPETRHSFGSRIWAMMPDWQYDLEGLYQFGNFAAGSISAWTMSANVSYTFQQSTLKPQVGIKTEAISGDKNHGDGRLNTFNPLFPKGAYFGLAALIGPYNLLDAHPYVQLKITKKLLFSSDYDLFWRMNRNDGLYAVNGKLLYPGKAGTSKQIGRQLGGALEYTPNKYLYFRQELTWFSAGDYLKEAGPGKDILMAGSTITFKF